MPTISLVGFFKNDDGYGWSEKHCVDGGVAVTSLTAYLNTFNALMINQRRPMLGRDVSYIGCRASYPTTDRKIASAAIVANPSIQGTQAIGSVKTWSTAAEVACKLRMANAGNTAFSEIYLRGIWDDVETAGVLDFGGALGSAWKALADAYTSALLQLSYGWEGINPATTSRGNVTNYVVGVDGKITFTTAVTNGVALPANGTRVYARFARLNNSNSVLNRGLVCTVESATSLKTVQTIAAAEFQDSGTYVVANKGFIPYASVGYYKLAKRACGRPFGLSPGRRAAKALN